MLTIRDAASESATEYVLCVPFEGLPDPEGLEPWHPSYEKDPLPLPPKPQPCIARWNCLDFPLWGASRHAAMHVLLTGDEYADLDAALGATKQVKVKWGDEQTSLTGDVLLHIVDAVPVADSRESTTSSIGGEQVLWWITLADPRYRNAQITYESGAYTTAAPATWGELLSDLIDQWNGQTYSASTIDALIDADYGRPTDLFASTYLRGRNVAVLIDAVCAIVNLRPYVAPETGEVTLHTATSAALSLTTTDLHAGGLRSQRIAATLSVVEYNRGGVTSTASVAVTGGDNGTLTVWLPLDSTGRTQYAADYKLWVAGDVPDMTLAGFHTPPTSPRVGRWVLDHDAAVTHLRADPDDYPWPLVGRPGETLPNDQLVNICVVRDGYGYVIDVRLTWKKPNGTYECELAPDCPECP
jgi:hypothetical protein